MHPIAEELNESLKGTIVDALLSDVGRRMFFPKGIVAQTAEAIGAGVRYNATQGVATEMGDAQILPTISQSYQLPPKQIVLYSPTGGVPKLRTAWRAELCKKNPTLPSGEGEFSQPIVTSGITHAISVAAELFAGPDTVVLIPSPFWGNYRLIFAERYGARIVTYPIFRREAGGRTLFNVVGLDEALTQHQSQKIVCIFNFPQNPTGYTPHTAEVQEIIEVLMRHATQGVRMVALCDDAYFGLQYEEGLMRESLFAQFAHSHNNILAIKGDGATKEEFAWGLRVGFITFASKGLQKTQYQALEKKVLGVIRGTLSNCNTAAQHALCAALQAEETHAEEKRRLVDVVRARYRELQRVLAMHADDNTIVPLPYNSGYFVTLRCAGFRPETLRRMLLERGIGIIAIDDEHIRVTYSTLEKEEIAPVFAEIFRCANTLVQT